MKPLLKDEKEWLNQETRFIDKILPFLKKKFLIKLLLFILILVIIAKYFKFFITLLFILFVSYIKFKRTKNMINIEIEPTYLLGIALALAFGLNYSFLFFLIPFFFSMIITGFGIGLLVNLISKLIVMFLVYFFWEFTRNETYMIFFAILIVIATDFFGFFIRKKFGQPIMEIIQGILTNALIRLAYFSLFLDLIIDLIK